MAPHGCEPIAPAARCRPRVQISADPTGLAPGTYQGIVTISSEIASPPQQTVAITFSVAVADAPHLRLDLKGLTFSLTQRSGSASSQLSVVNQNGGIIRLSPLSPRPAVAADG